MHIRVIGVPMDLGADRRGVDIGASAIRYAGLSDQLRHLNYEVNDIGNIVVPQPESQPIRRRTSQFDCKNKCAQAGTKSANWVGRR